MESVYIEFNCVIIIAVTVNNKFDTFSDTGGYEIITKNKVEKDTNFKSILLTIIVTFISSMIGYSVMYFIFGYGGGMLENNYLLCKSFEEDSSFTRLDT